MKDQGRVDQGMAFFDLYGPKFDADPFPVYSVLRDEYPCYWHDGAKKWFLTRYDDVTAALSSWQRFSSSKGNLVDEFEGRAGNTLGTMDPPRHDRLRALVQMAFSRKHLSGIEPFVRNLVRNILLKQTDRQRFDFVSEVSAQITVGALSRLLGINHDNPSELREKAMLMVQTDPVMRKKAPIHLEAMEWMKALASEQIAAKRAAPQDDVITSLIQAEIDGERLSEEELILTISTVIMAGVESLSGFLTMVTLNLADHSDARRAVARDKAKIPGLIEETLRYNTNTQRFKRVAMEDINLHGQTIKAGDEIVLCYGAANRDGRRFENPDVFDPQRTTRGHLGFGGGVHVCIGAVLARMVTKIFLEEFLETMPEFTRSEAALDWIPSTNFRAPKSLVLVRPSGQLDCA